MPPCLNTDIIFEIFIKANEKFCAEKWMLKFMLASKESSKIVMKLFNLPKNLEISGKRIDLEISNAPKKITHFYMLFASKLFNVSQKFICSSINELKISIWPSCCVVEKLNFKKLLSYDITTFTFGKYCNYFPKSLNLILFNNKSIQTFKILSSIFFDFPIHSPSKCEIIFEDFEFDRFLQRRQTMSITNVEKLRIENKNTEFRFEFKYLQKFLNYIGEHFPNLEFLNIYLRFNVFHYIYFEKMDVKIFEKIPLSVKGTIEFDGIFDDTKQWFITQAHQKSNVMVQEKNGKIIVSKEFEIHEELFFKFCAVSQRDHP